MITKKRVEIGVEEIILGLIIILNILAVLGALTTDLDYIKKIISWSALGYLLYQTKPTTLFTGVVDRRADSLLLLGYFMLFLKNLVSFSLMGETSSFLRPLYAALQLYAVQIEIAGLYAGMVIFLYIGIRLLLRHKIKDKSLLHLLGEKNTPLSNFRWLKRYIKIELLIIAFFVVIFSLVMEWLAVAIDAPLLMVGLATYFFFIIRHKEHFSERSFLRKFGDFGGDFYKNVIEHLRYKNTALRVVAGMLVLHLVTDTFIFIWSYLSGISDPIYFGAIGREQLSFGTSIIADSAVWGNFATLTITSLNVIGMLFLLLFPVIIWYELYKNKHDKIRHELLALFFTSLLSLVLAPTFVIKTLNNTVVYGIDIIAMRLQPLFHPLYIAIICVGFFSLLYMLSLRFRHVLSGILVFINLGFVSWYAISFYTSLVGYYTLVIPLTFKIGQYILGLFLSTLWLLTTLFYVVGTIYFIIDVTKHIKEHITVS